MLPQKTPRISEVFLFYVYCTSYTLLFKTSIIQALPVMNYERLRKHNSSHKGFTGKSGDWKVLYTKVYSQKSEAMKRELKIKSWKSWKEYSSLLLIKATTLFFS